MMNDNGNKIIDMYFNQKIRPTDIAQELHISRSAVTQMLKKNDKYEIEKCYRKEQNRVKHIQRTKEYIKEQREVQKKKKQEDDLILKQLHKTASIELSDRRTLSNENYWKWNTSAYLYNKDNNRFEFKDDELGRSYDVPKYIKTKK